MSRFAALGFWAATFGLVWVYVGYPWLMARVAARRPIDWSHLPLPDARPVVVIACHNEAPRIGARLEALRAHTWSDTPVSVLVVADRCTDGTVEVASAYPGVDVVALDGGPGGRASAHNAAFARVSADVLVFTDADTEFAPAFVDELLRPFSDPSVGCVVGRLSYRSGGSDVASSEGAYFEREVALRIGETACGVLATGTGACMAVRRILYRPLDPAHDVDFVTPLDVVFAGYRVVMAPDAVAWDMPPDSLAREWRVRFRQTTRNLSGTVGRWWSSRGWRFPAVTAGLLSHKVLRWATGWLILLQLGTGAVLFDGSWVVRLAVLANLALVVSGAVVVGLSALGVRTGRFSVFGAFLTACTAMAAGCVAAALGRARATYTPVAKTG